MSITMFISYPHCDVITPPPPPSVGHNVELPLYTFLEYKKPHCGFQVSKIRLDHNFALACIISQALLLLATGSAILCQTWLPAAIELAQFKN